MSKKMISEYYDYTLNSYRRFYHKESHALHYGFWDKSVKNHQEALLNVNRFLAETANITGDDIVLDAGCGVGGSALWLAKNYGTQVTGITLSQKQLEEAKKLSSQHGVEDKVNFYIRDYTNSGFEDASFSVIWAIESVCHAEDKKDFIKEAYRLLKNGGRLIVCDGFQIRQPKNKREEKYLAAFLKGMVLPNLDFDADFQTSLKEIGFKNIKMYDKTVETIPSSKKIHQMCVWGYPLARIAEKLHLTPRLLTENNLAGVTQYSIIKDGLIGNRVFYCEK